MTEEPLAARFRRLRQALHLSQDQLSKAAGTTANHVYQVEAGKRRRLNYSTAELYAEALRPAMPEAAQARAVDYLLFGYVPPVEDPDIEYPAWARGMPDLRPEHVEYIRRTIEIIRAREDAEMRLEHDEDESA